MAEKLRYYVPPKTKDGHPTGDCPVCKTKNSLIYDIGNNYVSEAWICGAAGCGLWFTKEDFPSEPIAAAKFRENLIKEIL